MTKIDIFSGFLGAGKTTLIKKLLKESFGNEKVVLIENEFGQIGIDGGFLKECGVQVTEMNSGCICCSLVGDFKGALEQVLTDFSPDRILIEPSGVGKLSDVIRAVQSVQGDAVLNSATAVVDATKCKMYMKNFGEFFNDQIKSASCLILSHTDGIAPEKLDVALALLKEQNEHATLVTTPWSQLEGARIVAAMEQRGTLQQHLEELAHEQEHHHGHDECDDPDCHCHDHHHEHHHDHGECDDPDCHCHEHHDEHHHGHGECDDPDCHCHEHHHEHHDDHHHHHHHHSHHHADEVFSTWGVETAKIYTPEQVEACLYALQQPCYGTVLRAKGIVAGGDGWIHFDYVPGAADVRAGAADVIGRLCVIGTDLDKSALATLFGIEA